jgi:predicted aspartyl protease
LQESKNCWNYQEHDARVKIPVIPLKIVVNTSPKEYNFILDTGFDGQLLIPYKTYNDLKLQRFELPPDLWALGESISGELKPLRCSKALVRNEKLSFSQIVEIETFEQNDQFLLGLSLLRNFQTLLEGRSEQVCLSYT